jgi:hypothetical protein
MIVSEAADKLLGLLEQTDEEEYTKALAVAHIGQAIHELAEENEFRFYNKISEYTLETPASGEEPSYWTDVPGRAPLLTVLGATWGTLAYIKNVWVSISDDVTIHMRERSFDQLMDEYADTEGYPEAFAVDGEYFYWRQIAEAGTDYTIRVQWQEMPALPTEGEEPIMLAQLPYGVLYKAATIASVWLLDDNRVPMFQALAQNAFERYNARYAMTGDGIESMEEFNG